MKAYYYIRQSGITIRQTDPNEAVLHELYVDPDDREHGVGTRLMEKTCHDADREGVTLFVTPHPFSSYDIDNDTFYPPGLSYTELCAFYRKFGFRFKSKEQIMMRKPKEE